MKKLYCRNGNEYGVVGEETNVVGFYVGDIVEIKRFNGEKIHSVVCKVNNHSFVFGWRPISLTEIIIQNEMKKVYDCFEVKDEMLQKCRYRLTIK